nr:MAG TPA: hypothetical protein [Caudoviricetes sp.]
MKIILFFQETFITSLSNFYFKRRRNKVTLLNYLYLNQFFLFQKMKRKLNKLNKIGKRLRNKRLLEVVTIRPSSTCCFC